MSDYIPALIVYPIYYNIETKDQGLKFSLGRLSLLRKDEEGNDSKISQEGENFQGRRWRSLPVIFTKEIRIRIAIQNPLFWQTQMQKVAYNRIDEPMHSHRTEESTHFLVLKFS
jgi:hypothetical protein